MATVNPYEAEVQRRRRELEAQAAMLRKGGLTPEQMAVLAQESGYDGSDRQEMMSDMLRTGQAALIGGEIPAGKQMGNVYAPPSWSEALNAAAQRALGGYQMGQARKEGKEIDARTEAALKAKQAIANEQARIEQLGGVEKQQDAMLRQAGQDAMAARRLEQAAALAAANRSAQDARLSRTLAAQESRSRAKEDREGKKRTVVTFHDPSDPSSSLNLRRDSSGNFYDFDGNQMPAEFVKALTPYTPSTTGSVAKARIAEGKKEAGNDSTLLGVDQASMTILDPNLGTATGHPLDPERWLSTYGVEGYEGPQATQTRAAAVTMEAVAPTLDKLGVNPTDADLREAFKTAPGVGTQPEGWLDWYKGTYMPFIDRQLARDNPTMRDAYMQQMQSTLDRATEIQIQEKNKRKQPASAGWSVKVN